MPRLHPSTNILQAIIVMAGMVWAQDDTLEILPSNESFSPPKAYPVERYEKGWDTNPFTLKTAAPAVQKESFAKDLALANMSDINGEKIVVLINTRTRERTRLSTASPHPSGIIIKSAHILNSLRDSYAEIAKDGEVAMLKYDADLQKQLVAQAQQNPTAAAGASHSNTHITGRGSPSGSTSSASTNPNSSRTSNSNPGTRGATTSSANRNAGAAPANLTPPERNSPPLRRRLLTAPRPITPAGPSAAPPPSVTR